MVADQWNAGAAGVVGYNLPGAVSYLRDIGLYTAEIALKLRVISDMALAKVREKREEAGGG